MSTPERDLREIIRAVLTEIERADYDEPIAPARFRGRRNARLTIRISPALKHALRRAADRERRSVTDLVTFALEARLARHARTATHIEPRRDRV